MSTAGSLPFPRAGTARRDRLRLWLVCRVGGDEPGQCRGRRHAVRFGPREPLGGRQAAAAEPAVAGRAAAARSALAGKRRTRNARRCDRKADRSDQQPGERCRGQHGPAAPPQTANRSTTEHGRPFVNHAVSTNGTSLPLDAFPRQAHRQHTRERMSVVLSRQFVVDEMA